MPNGYAVTNGIRMHYAEMGEGSLILMCHGFPEIGYSWRHQMGSLAEAGYRAVAVDMPGYGLSDKPAVAYDLVWLAECIAGMISSLGADRAVVCGHDWG